MIEEGRRSIGRAAKEEGERTAAGLKWSAMPVEMLVKYRDEITQALPPLALSKMNLEEEMLLQYHVLRSVQGRVMDDDDVPVNQRAQIANTVGASLAKLADLQVTLYNSERYKMVENLLIRTLNRLPEKAAATFLTEYEKILKKHG